MATVSPLRTIDFFKSIDVRETLSALPIICVYDRHALSKEHRNIYNDAFIVLYNLHYSAY